MTIIGRHKKANISGKQRTLLSSPEVRAKLDEIEFIVYHTLTHYRRSRDNKKIIMKMSADDFNKLLVVNPSIKIHTS